VELEKRRLGVGGVEWWTRFDVRVPRTLDYPIVNINPRKSAPYDHNARPSQMDRYHGNSAMIRSNECIAR